MFFNTFSKKQIFYSLNNDFCIFHRNKHFKILVIIIIKSYLTLIIYSLASTLIAYYRRLFVDNKSHARLRMSSNVYHDMMNIIIGYITV
ncbi:hypothetical protein TUM20400_01020 [Staphylococcus aureus]|nr:hypothetical protein TUM20400_01020 [Staphylococcus aureus]